MYYKDFLKTFDVVEYLSDTKRQEISGQKDAFEKKLQEIEENNKKGFVLMPLKVVGEIWQQKDLHIPYFFEIDRYAYTGGDKTRVYATIKYIFALVTGIEDKNGDVVFKSVNDEDFIVKYYGGSPSYLPYIKLQKPCWID